MNILFIATSNFKPEPGGIAELGHQLANALSNKSHKITVIANKYQNSEYFDNSINYTIIRIDKNKLFSYMFNFIKNNDIDLIFVLSIGSGIFSSILCGKYFKIPISLYIHGLEITKHKGNLFLRVIKNKIKNIFLHQCDLLFCNSFNTMKLILKQNIPSIKIGILHPGIDHNIINSDIDVENIDKIDNNIFVFLTLGRIIERKGIDTVIKALPIVVSKYNNIKYIIAGPIDEYYKNYLLKLAKDLHVESYISILGYIDDNQKKYLLKRQNCFIMPSKELKNGDVEGFGIVFLEAALYEKPSIGGFSGGIPDAVINNKTGLLIDPNSIESISNAMIELISNSDLCNELGKNAKQRAIQRFNWEKQALLFESYFINDKTIAQTLNKTDEKYFNKLDSLQLTNPIDKIAAYENLCILKEILDLSSIPFFLFFGTLLGALRENDFITHDYDTDIVILESYKKLFITIIPELELKGIILARTTKEDRVISLYRNGAYIDIYFATTIKVFFHDKWYIDYSTIPKKYLLDFKYIDFKNIKVLIPQESEKILIRFYGQNWNIPKKDYEANPDYYMKLIRFIKSKNKLKSLKRFIFWKKKRNIYDTK